MGRGIFAIKSYMIGDIIEDCPMIILDAANRTLIDKTYLYNYYFSWGKKSNEAAIALGYGSLYNHSYQPNAKYIKLLDKDIIQIIAFQHIEPGDEIKVNYNGEPTSTKALWFNATD
ncbi:SET domain-containing protein-lysine N-methyltransferase [soil metagenome]